MPGPNPATLDPRIYNLNLPLGFGGVPVPYMDPETLAAYNALQRKYRENMDQLLRTEADIPIKYNAALFDIDRARREGLKKVTTSMADRGLTDSGINLGEQTRAHQVYDKNVATSGEAMRTALDEVARKKLSSLLGLQEGTGQLFRQGIATGVATGRVR